MTETKHLNTLAVATLTTDIVMVRGMEGVYEAAAHIMGHDVFTHEFGLYHETIKDRVAAQLPDFPVEKPADWQATRKWLLDHYGPTVEMMGGADERTAHPVDTLAAAVARARGEVVIGTKDGERCNRVNRVAHEDQPCGGVMVTYEARECQCHRGAPCRQCRAQRPTCATCGKSGAE